MKEVKRATSTAWRALQDVTSRVGGSPAWHYGSGLGPKQAHHLHDPSTERIEHDSQGTDGSFAFAAR